MTHTVAGLRSNVRQPLNLVTVDMDIQIFADEAYKKFVSNRSGEEYEYRLDHSLHRDELWYLTDDQLQFGEIQQIVDGIGSTSPFDVLPEDQSTKSLFIRNSNSEDICVMQIESRHRLKPQRAFFRLDDSFSYKNISKLGLVIPESLVAIIRTTNNPILYFDNFSNIAKVFNTTRIFDEQSMEHFYTFSNFCDFQEVDGVTGEHFFERTLSKPLKEKIVRVCSPNYEGGRCVMEILTEERIYQIEQILTEKKAPVPSHSNGRFILRTDYSRTQVQLLLDLLTDKLFLSLLDDSLRRTTTSHPAIVQSS